MRASLDGITNRGFARMANQLHVDYDCHRALARGRADPGEFEGSEPGFESLDVFPHAFPHVFPHVGLESRSGRRQSHRPCLHSHPQRRALWLRSKRVTGVHLLLFMGMDWEALRATQRPMERTVAHPSGRA